MASSRTSAMRSLNRLAISSRQARQLHITGSASHPVRIAVSDKSILGSQVSGSKSEHDESIRAFSTSDSTYDSPHALHATAHREYPADLPTPIPTPFTPTNQKSRNFNTSRQLKRVGDSSTIDFAYLPTFPIPSVDASTDDIRVPLVPWNFTPRPEEQLPPSVSEIMTEEEQSVSTAAADGTHISAPSAMADVHDGGGHLLDFHEMAEALTNAAKNVALGTDREAQEEAKRAKGLVKQVWTGLVSDIFGQKTPKA